MGTGVNDNNARAITPKPLIDATEKAAQPVAEPVRSPFPNIDQPSRGTQEDSIACNGVATCVSTEIKCPTAVSSSAIPAATATPEEKARMASTCDFAPAGNGLVSEVLATIQQPLTMDASAEGGTVVRALDSSAEGEAIPTLPIGLRMRPTAKTSPMRKPVTPLRLMSDKRRVDGSSPVTIADMMDFTPSPRHSPSAARNLLVRAMQNQTGQQPVMTPHLGPFTRRTRSRSAGIEVLEQLSPSRKRVIVSPHSEMFAMQNTATPPLHPTAFSPASMSQLSGQTCLGPVSRSMNTFSPVKQSPSGSLFSMPALANGSPYRIPLPVNHAAFARETRDQTKASVPMQEAPSIEDTGKVSRPVGRPPGNKNVQPGEVRRGRGRPRKNEPKAAPAKPKRKRVYNTTPEKIEAMQAGRRHARELRQQQAANSDTPRESRRLRDVLVARHRGAQMAVDTEIEQHMQRNTSVTAASNEGPPGALQEDERLPSEMEVNDVGMRAGGARKVVRYRLNARTEQGALKRARRAPSMRAELMIEGKRKKRDPKVSRQMEAQQALLGASEGLETPGRTTSGSYLYLIASRRLRAPLMICEDEPITYESWKAKLKKWDLATATSSHTSSSSRAAPFPFEQPPVLYPELMPKALDACGDKNDIKLIGRRKPGNQPLPDLIYDITKVPAAAEDSIIFRTKSRDVWTALVPEMSILSAEAGWRNLHLLSKRDLHTYDSKPLRMDYIYDRMTCDDPIDGWQVRCRHSGQLQGFLTYTNFVTYQPMVFHGDPPDLISKLNISHRQNSYWFGCVWPEVVELVLLGALGCGTLLMEEFLDSLVNTDVKFIIIHATVHARRYYEKLGFTRVKACARYDVKNRQLRTPTVTSAGYDGGYGFHMLLLQIAARADRGFFTSITQAWKAFEPQIDRGHKMDAKKIYDFYRNQYRVQEEFQVNATSPKYIHAFMRDPACYPYHHWQFKSVTSSELEDPSLLLVLELSEWTGRKITSKTCTQPVVEWKCPPLYQWVNPHPAKLTPRSLTYIPKGAPGRLSRFTYWYILELIPDLRWAHLVPMIQKGSFPVESARKGRPRYCLQPREEHERELSMSMDRLVPVAADCIRGKGSDPDQDLWDVKNFNPQNYEE
eukprot:GEMP01005207.1.p1 GENE.GEMP01005207.1~~GEMP01005207.1.p1  ORF type:complete len:1122 (+),score=207.51 GEMP01005207.1:229-3594(+)